MGDCILPCVDAIDDRRYRATVIGILQAFLAGNAVKDTEVTVLYDVNAGVYTPFYRILTVECDGDIVVTDYAIDGVTPYTPTGTVTPISPDVPDVHTTETAVAHTLSLSGDHTIPLNFIHASIAIVSGTASIDGVSFPEGSTLSLPPMSFGDVDRLYPALAITAVTGQVLVNYYTKV